MNNVLKLVTLAATSLTLMAGCNNNQNSESVTQRADSVPATKIQPMESNEAETPKMHP